MSHDHQKARLEAENEMLRYRVANLEAQLYGGVEDYLPREWRLTWSEERIFRTLVAAKGIATKDILLLSIIDPMDETGGPEVKIIDVFMCKIRKKLAPSGIVITTHWGRGYSIEAAVKDRFKPKAKEAA